MDRGIPAANKICSRRWEEAQHRRHRKKLNTMKASVDNKGPSEYSHMRYNAKKATQQ
ncbi:hypothetical protein KIPB_014510, partial [Kipferlia bialata]|eukprot:g14510.t1